MADTEADHRADQRESFPTHPATEPAAGPADVSRPSPGRRDLWWSLIVVPPLLAGVLAVLLQGAHAYAVVSRTDPGTGTSLASVLVRTVALMSSVLCAGALTYLLTLRSAVGRNGADRLFIGAAPELTWLRTASSLWLIAAVAGFVVDAADASGLPVSTMLRPDAGWTLITSAYLPRAWAVVALCALVVHIVSWTALRWEHLLPAAAATALGLLAPVAVGHLLVGPNHDVGSDSGYVLTVVTAIGIGATFVLARRSAAGLVVSATTRRRWAGLLVVAAVVGLLAEVSVFLFEAAGDPLKSGWTGVLAGVRVLTLLLLGGVGLRVRQGVRGALTSEPSGGPSGEPSGGPSDEANEPLRRTSRAASTWARGPVPLWLGTGAGAVYLAAAIAETRIAPPQYFVPTSIQQVFLGFEVPDAPTLAVLATQWRINVFFTLLAAVACGLYLWGVRRLHRRGDQWPLARTLPWLGGWLVITVSLSSGLGRYATASFSLHMLLHMVLTMLGPLLLTLGGPVTLALRVTRPTKVGEPSGPHEWVVAALHSRLLTTLWNPLPTFIVFVASFYLLYLTPLFDVLMRYHYAHQAMNLHFLVSGYLFYGLVIGVDRPPRPLPHLGRLGFVLAAMPFHAFFAVAIMTHTDIIAETFYSYLDPVWNTDLATDLLHDQYVGGGIAWAAGEIPLIIVVLVLCASWSRQDAREAARIDRKADRSTSVTSPARAETAKSRAGRGSDPSDDFDAYNEMLARLAERDRRGGNRP